MDKIDQKLSQKERELNEYLAHIEDPHLRQIIADINALRRTKELVADTSEETPAPIVSQNGHTPATGTLTQGDAVVEILRRAGRPVHINDIMQELVSRYGLQPKRKSSLVSNIRKDRQNRFIGKGGGLWDLRDGNGAKPSSKPLRSSGSTGKSPLTRAGFSLIGAIKDLLPHLQGEISQPIVTKKLREKHPEMADRIQKASVATTLRKLQEDGLLEISHQGYGSDPRRYRKVSK